MPFFELRNVRAGYGKSVVIRDVAIAMEMSDLTVVIGPNGAGKSTLLRTIYGLSTLFEGMILYKGDDMAKWPPKKMASAGVAFVPQENNVFPSLRVMENLKLMSEKQVATFQERLNQVFDLFPVLKERRNQRAETLSGGESKMLAVGLGLMEAPELLLLDEPSGGLAPILVDVLFEAFKKIHQAGTAILLVEQNAKKAFALADYGYIIEGGKIRYQGKARELMGNEEVIKSYFGV
jgi:ABC-type branched-subunit amino acid transport system ATPase component